MSLSSIQNNVTVVIAHRGSDRHFLDVILDLKLWFNDIVVVGPDCDSVMEKIQDLKKSWIKTDSFNLLELWEKGIRSKKSSWYLLLESREYLSTALKESIVETTKSNPDHQTWFPIKRNIFLFKQRLKYQLRWTHDPIPGLLFSGLEKTPQLGYLANLENLPLKGESNYFGENNIFEAIQNTKYRADQAADQLYQINPDLNKLRLTSKALITFLPNIFRNLIVCRGIREGFEGLAFVLLDLMSEVLGYLRYYEKYIRSGKQIQDQLSSVKKVLVIKLRGLGDAVIATSVIKNLNMMMPDVSISILTFNFCKPIFENNPRIKSIYGLSGESSKSELSQLAKKLSKKKFDLVLNLHSKNLSVRLTRKIKSRWCINRSYFLREKFSDVMVGSDHELDRSSVDRDLDCLRAIGLNSTEKSSELFISTTETLWAREYLNEIGVDLSKKLIVIHPSSSQFYRSWGLDQFIILSNKLIKDHNCQVMAVLSKKEQPIADSIKKQVKGAQFYIGPLRPSMALINEADLMIDNDSGPAHISAALKIPTVVLVGADYKNAYRDKDIYQKNHYVFCRDVPCRDLFFTRCLTPSPCEKLICEDHPVEEVLEKSLELLKKV
jgi:heptosyltransferase III